MSQVSHRRIPQPGAGTGGWVFVGDLLTAVGTFAWVRHGYFLQAMKGMIVAPMTMMILKDQFQSGWSLVRAA